MARILGVSEKTIAREETSREVSEMYRLACAAVVIEGVREEKWMWDPDELVARCIRVASGRVHNELNELRNKLMATRRP